MGSPLFSLEGKVAIVTGSGRGIGRGIALELASAGADVVVAGINLYDPSKTDAELEAVAAEVRDRGVKTIAVPADVRQSEQVDEMVQKAVENFGGVDIMVSNVGGSFSAPFSEVKGKALEAVVRENLVTSFLCSKAAAKVMVEQKKKGSIVNIASISGFLASPNLAHYGAAKAGVISLTKSLALELSPYHIRVNAVAPGLIEHEGTVGRPYQDDTERTRIISRIPLGHSGRPQDIAGAVVYLASDAAYHVTGITIPVDGGASLNWL